MLTVSDVRLCESVETSVDVAIVLAIEVVVVIVGSMLVPTLISNIIIILLYRRHWSLSILHF